MPMVQALCREWKWWLLIDTDNFEFRFLTFGLLFFSPPCFSMYFNFLSLVVMQHRISLINWLQCWERLWNFATPEEVWPVGWTVGLASGTSAFFSCSCLAWANTADLNLQKGFPNFGCSSSLFTLRVFSQNCVQNSIFFVYSHCLFCYLILHLITTWDYLHQTV